ncbi:MAG: ABC transporter substrate-binding protein, partial [Bacteroidota bacterium]
MNKISLSLPFVLVLFSTLFLLTNCRTDPKVEEETIEYKRTVNEVIIAPLNEPDNLNPVLTTDNIALNAIGYMFQPLQAINPATLALEPLLVKSAPETKEEGDGIAYTFELREDAVWPNGSPITAEDVTFSIKAILNPKVPTRFRALLSPFSDLILDDENPKKFTIVMKGKNIRNEAVASSSFFILPAYHYDAQNLLSDISVKDLLDPKKAENLAASNPNLQAFADEFLKPKYAREVDGVVGSGPYRLAEWVTGQSVTLEKKEDWWGDSVEDNVYYGNNVDKIIMQPIGEANVAVAAMQNEEIDIIGGMVPET